MNKVIVLCRLTKPIEIKTLNSGAIVATASIAFNNKVKKNGNYEDVPCFMECKIFGNLATFINNYTTKGSQILVEGKLHMDSWQDQQGDKKNKITIIAESIWLMDNRKEKQENNNLNNQQTSPQIDIDDDEIPF